MSYLQDTPQQALAGWLHQRGGEKAIKKMAEDLDLPKSIIEMLMNMSVPSSNLLASDPTIAICLYTDGEVIFPSCPDWAVQKAKRQRYERSWLFKLWRFFHV